MSDDDQFCPECGVSLDLHDDDGEGCDVAEAKARLLERFGGWMR